MPRLSERRLDLGRCHELEERRRGGFLVVEDPDQALAGFVQVWRGPQVGQSHLSRGRPVRLK